MMEVITTIYYDGQFWAALVEKITQDGTIATGRHVFGQEPTAGDIRDFYMNSYDTLPLRTSSRRVRLKKRRSPKEQDRTFSKSLITFHESRTEFLKENRKEVKKAKEEEKEEIYRRKQEKKKRKKRGR